MFTSLGGRQGAFYQHALQQNIAESLEPPSLALLSIDVEFPFDELRARSKLSKTRNFFRAKK